MMKLRTLLLLTVLCLLPSTTMAQVAQPTGCQAPDQGNVCLGSGATSTTAVVLTNYSRTLGTALDFTDADTLLVRCTGG